MRVMLIHKKTDYTVLVLASGPDPQPGQLRTMGSDHLPHVIDGLVAEGGKTDIYLDLSKVSLMSGWDTSDMIKAFEIISSSGKKPCLIGCSPDVNRRLKMRVAGLFECFSDINQALARPSG